VEDLSTLKATSTFGEEWLKVPLTGKYHREKVALAMLKAVKATGSPRYVDVLNWSLDCMHREGCIYMCLFPKDQVAGVREIYVMKLTGRVAQSLVEYAGKILCNKVPSEIITHPENKYTRLHDHQDGMAHKGNHVTFGSSCDMTKWNHTNYISKLYYNIAPHFEPEIRPLLFEIMSFWEKKKIMVPQQLTEALMKHEVINTTSTTINQYHAAIKHGVRSQCFEPGECSINTTHGFCQGLFQMVSSFLHVQGMHYFKIFIHREFEDFKAHKRLPRDCKLYMTDMVSSDDSSLLISVTYTNERSRPAVEYFCAYAARCRTFLMKQLGMVDSTKSVIHTSNFLEFNSKFTIGRFTYEPLVRQIHALANITETEGILARQEEAYGILEGLHEYGASILTCSVYQMAQAVNQYRLLGSSVCRFFDNFYDLIKFAPDPSLGFVVLDDPRACGLTGIRYNLWIASFHPSVETKLSSLLRYSTTYGVKAKVSAGLTKHGFALGSSLMCLGDFRKALAAYNKAGLPKDWRKFYDEHPYSLFRDSRTITELEHAIARKMNSTGAINAYANGSLPALIGPKSSVFMPYRLSIRMVKIDVVDDSAEAKYHKTSIMRELQHYSERDNYCYWTSSDGSHHLSTEDRAVIFPSNDSYVKVQSVLNMFIEVDSVSRDFNKDYKKRVKVAVFDGLSEQQSNLAHVAGVHWGFIPKSDSHNKLIFKKFQEKFTWLHDEFSETLKGPFEDTVDLYNFLCAYKPDKRYVRLMTKPIKTFSGLAPLKSIIESHYYPNYSLSTVNLPDFDYIIPTDFYDYEYEDILMPQEGQIIPRGITAADIQATRPSRILSMDPMQRTLPSTSSIQMSDRGTPVESLDSRVQLTTTRPLANLYHELHSILTLPFTENAKCRLVKKAMVTHPRINLAPENKNSRDNMLALIQAN
jgi:hypothetical protein